MDRRDFIALSTSLTAAAMVGCSKDMAVTGPDESDARLDRSIELLNVVWDKAPCRYCGTGCGVEVGVRDRRVVAVRGDEKAEVNRGLLCAKGYHLPVMLYGKDRLMHPMRRSSDGALTRISWDEALQLIADKYSESIRAHGPDSVAIYGSGQWTIFDGYAANKWFKAGLRSNNIDPNARLCMASAVMGFMTQFQSDEPMGCYDDLDVGDDFVLWGNNMAEMHPVLFSRMLENKRKNPSVRIVDIATRWTPTSDFADLVQIIPGSDLTLANGILHLLIKNGKLDRPFMDQNLIFQRGIEDLAAIGYGCFDKQADGYSFQDQAKASSFEELTKFLDDYDPESVSKTTGVSVAKIESLANVYGDLQRGTVSLWCMGVNQHTRGTWMNNLITNLHLVTGKISRPGNNPFSLTGQPSACGTAHEVGTLSNRLPADMVVNNPEHRAKAEKIWNLPAGTINAKPGLHTVNMFRALQRGDVKVMWIQVTNPWVTLPNLNRFQRKPGDGRFIIVSDIYPTPTTDVADLILPSAAWVEREGMFGNSERRTQHWNKMIDPPGEAKEDAWQIMQVARRMGLGHLFPWGNDSNWHEQMFEEYRQFTIGTGKDLASYEQLQHARGMHWPVVEGKETRYRYAAGHDPYVKQDHGVHFYLAKGYGGKAAVWLRPYHPPAEVPDASYPFWLSTGRVLEHWHTGSMTRRVPQLHQAVPTAYAELNREDATRLGIQDGEMVKLVSRRGEIQLSAKIDDRGKPPSGTVFVPFFDESILINQLTLDAMDNISKEPDYKKCAVRVEKI